MAKDGSRVYVVGGERYLAHAVGAALTRSGYTIVPVEPPSRVGCRVPHRFQCGDSDGSPLASLTREDAVVSLPSNHREPLGQARLLEALVAGAARPPCRLLVVTTARPIATPLLPAAGLETTLLEAAPVFGPGDELTTGLARWIRRMPVLVLPHESVLFAPVYSGDVAAAVCMALGRATSRGQRYRLVGPETFTMRSLVSYLARALGVTRPIIELPAQASWIARKWLPFRIVGAPLVPKAEVADGLASFGIAPHPLSRMICAYLA